MRPIKTARVFFDMEFTGLTQHDHLLSIGMVVTNPHTPYDDPVDTFYGETHPSECPRTRVPEWVRENVLPLLQNRPESWYSKAELAMKIKELLKPYDHVEFWGDCLAYDWVHFCELFGGVLKLPSNFYYIPFDLCTLLFLKNLDPDINRLEFSGLTMSYPPKELRGHHALDDAHVVAACVAKLLSGAPNLTQS